MNALGAAILVVVASVVLLAPRRWALLGMVAGVMYLTQAQRLDVGEFNIYAARFVELAGFARVVMRKELALKQLNRLDWMLIALHLFTVTVFVLRSNEPKTYEVGVAVDALLSYLSFRALVDGIDTFRWFLLRFLILLLPYGVLVGIETLTFKNPFAALGGVEMAKGGDLWVRGGRLRAAGSFGHPSLMGTVGAAFLPLYLGLWLEGRMRAIATLGIAGCLALVWASNSGGPATCVAFAVIGWMFWTLRRSMEWVRRALLAVLVIFAILMKAPFWFLIARLGNIIGGDGWHRAELLDAALRNLDRWWFVGMPLLDTSGWLPYRNTLTGAVDMTNHFLVFGIAAGLGSVVLLIAVLTQGFKHVGRALATAEADPSRFRESRFIYWALGVTLNVHLANWFSITYWDQVSLIWFCHVALISSLTSEALAGQDEQQDAAGKAATVPLNPLINQGTGRQA